MSSPQDNSVHAAIQAKLASLVAASPTPPSWFEAWYARPQMPAMTSALKVYQAIRAAQSVPEEAGLYLVSRVIDDIADQDAEQELRPFEDRMAAIKKAHALGEDEFWPVGEGPSEYEEGGGNEMGPGMPTSRSSWSNAASQIWPDSSVSTASVLKNSTRPAGDSFTVRFQTMALIPPPGWLSCSMTSVPALRPKVPWGHRDCAITKMKNCGRSGFTRRR